MKTTTIALLVLTMPLGAWAASPDSGFYVEAAQGGMAEVALGKLAAGKAANADVRKFGAQMVTDHTKANTKLKAVAVKKSVTLPAAPDESQQATKKKLEGMTGASFDAAYLETQVADHEKTVSLLEKEISSGEDADAKAWATETLPTVKMHLAMVKKLADGSAHAAH